MTTRKGRPYGAVLLTLALGVGACGDDGPTAPPALEKIEEVEFHPSLGIVLGDMEVSGDGVYWIDTDPGAGAEAVPGADVAVSYRLYTRDGVLREDSGDRGGPLEFVLDDPESLLIEGFHEGVRGMRVGGERRFILPPELAYGTPGPQGILIFDVLLESATAP